MKDVIEALPTILGLPRAYFLVLLLFCALAWCFRHVKRWADLGRLLTCMGAGVGIATVVLLVL